ncbi:uncharacterized protein LOC5522001 isoform X2 [Nematostella vectensis]|uniref:uncharacterized protein LOC5522001 isoform X2 n=1 Tax=Nematostella vectensis TaxID=45351 RepID=UPI002077026F|nr:uncharacterized protein LOC5522001 isoform X2 [Nematostella vectensis]
MGLSKQFFGKDFLPFIVFAVCCLGQSPTVSSSLSASPNSTLNSTEVQPTPTTTASHTASLEASINQSASISAQGVNGASINATATSGLVPSSSVSGQGQGHGSGTTTSAPTTSALSSEEQAFNNNVDQAYSKVKMNLTTKLDPMETIERDKTFLYKLNEFMESAPSLERELIALNKSLELVKVDQFSAVQVKSIPDCLTPSNNIFPKKSVAENIDNSFGTTSIQQTFTCPVIIKNDTSPSVSRSRRRRDVEISIELEMNHDDDEMSDYYRNVNRYLRSRREVQASLSNTTCKPLPCNVTRIQIKMKFPAMNWSKTLEDENSADYTMLNDKLKFALHAASDERFNGTLNYTYHKAIFSSGSVVALIYVDVPSPFKDQYIALFDTIVKNQTFAGENTMPSFVTIGDVVVVDGDWTVWGPWQDNCDSNYEQTRQRSCTSPSPAHAGKKCSGDAVEKRKCSCNAILESGGNITSPFYPSNYPTNVLCKWTLVVPINYTVELNIADFQLEKDKKCFYDYIRVLDGNTTDAAELLPRTCGTLGSRKIVSTGRILMLEFHSDRDVIAKGFRAEWKKVVMKVPVKKTIEYVPQNVSFTNLITCPSFNGTAVPIGRGTTCPSYSPEIGCIFDKPVFLISCFIGVHMSRNDLPLTGDNTVKITLQHLMHKGLFPKYYIGDKYCVTWNKTARMTLDGGWTRRGCSVSSTNLTHTECECDHVGMFAVVSSEKTIYSKLEFLANTYIAVAVSLFILLAAIAHMIWKINIHGGEVMRISMCASIIYMEIIFVVGANVKAEQTLCGFLSFSIYFSVLAQFCWLLLHALRLHGKIKEIFASGLNIDAVYVTVGWGLPLLLSLIAIGIQIDLKNPEDVCWTAAAGGGMWGYSAPLLIIVLVNVAVLVTLLIPTKERLEKYDYREMRYRVLKDAVFLVFFGTTCLFAYQAVAQESFQAQYYLTISVVLQAVVMFIFGREGRKDFKKTKEKKGECEHDSQHTNEEDLPEKGEEQSIHHLDQEGDEEKPNDQDEEEGNTKGKKRKGKHQQEKIKVSTLKNLNIYKEDGHYVIEA